MNKLNTLENGLIFLNTYIGLQNIKDVMGLIILGFQFIIILIKVICLIKEKIKQKKYNEIDDVLKENMDQLNELMGNVDRYIEEGDEIYDVKK